MTHLLIYAQAGVADTIAHISLSEIAKWYGLMCLALMPLSLFVMVWIQRKHPSMVKRLDAAVDRLVDGKAGKDAAKAKNKDVPAEQNTQQKTMSIEESNELCGIANMELLVGDKYQCGLTEKNASDLGGGMSWGTTNPFVGNINESKGVFMACKAGKTYIKCGPNEVRIYYVDIKPQHKDWFGYLPMRDLLERESMATIKVREIRRRIRDIDDGRATLTYEWPAGTLSYQADKEGRVSRFMFRLPKDTDTTFIKERMTEYMELLPDDGSGRTYWFHKEPDGEDGPLSIDAAAFMMRSADGGIYFGAGVYWRSGAQEYDLQNNAEVMVRTFRDIMDPRDVPRTAGARLTVEYTDEEKKAMRRREQAARRASGSPAIKTRRKADRNNTDLPAPEALIEDEKVERTKAAAPDDTHEGDEAEEQPYNEEGQDYGYEQEYDIDGGDPLDQMPDGFDEY